MHKYMLLNTLAEACASLRNSENRDTVKEAIKEAQTRLKLHGRNYCAELSHAVQSVQAAIFQVHHLR
jgi:hypothetical protein